jgi:hypothetical protein
MLVVVKGWWRGEEYLTGFERRGDDVVGEERRKGEGECVLHLFD